MTQEQLETAQRLKEILSNIEYLFGLYNSNRTNIADALYCVYCYDKTFKESFDDLIEETKERLQREFDEL